MIVNPIVYVENNSTAAAPANGGAKSRVLIVDDHPLVRDGLTRVLSQQKDLACCGQAGTAPETFTAIRVPGPTWSFWICGSKTATDWS